MSRKPRRQAPPPPMQGRWTYAPRTESVRITKGHTNNKLHGWLTVATCGMWAPIWIREAYKNNTRQRKTTTNHYYG